MENYHHKISKDIIDKISKEDIDRLLNIQEEYVFCIPIEGEPYRISSLFRPNRPEPGIVLSGIIDKLIKLELNKSSKDILRNMSNSREICNQIFTESLVEYNKRVDDVIKSVIKVKENIPLKYCQLADLNLNYNIQDSKKGWYLQVLLSCSLCDFNKRSDHEKCLIYVEENAINHCKPNKATYIKNYFTRPGGFPHLFGDSIMIIPKSNFIAGYSSGDTEYRVTRNDYDTIYY